MTVRTKPRLPIGLAIYPIALALAACGESENLASIESAGVNVAGGYVGECTHIADAADVVGYNSTGDPPVVRIVTAGVEGNLPCPTLERSVESRPEEHASPRLAEEPPSRTGRIQTAVRKITPILRRIPRR